MTFLNGCKVWSADGKRMLAYAKAPENHPKFYKDAEFQHSFQGITSVTAKNGKEAICVANSTGEIYFLENTKENYFTSFVGAVVKTEPFFTCLASCKTYPILLASDAQGFVYIFTLDGLKENKMVQTIDLNNKNNPVTAMEVLEKNERALLITGDALGKIKIHDILSYNPLVEINAHFRPVMGLDVSVEKGLIVSGSEDTYAHVWKVNIGSEVKVEKIASQHWQDKVIVGCRFLKKGKLDLLLTHYDAMDITVVSNINV